MDVSVVHRAIVIVATVCCAFVGASFTMFALDQIGGASKHQQNEIAASPATAPTLPKPVSQEGQPRRFIDDAARTLTSPFHSIVQSESQWVLHGLPTIFALLVYGVGLGYLARYSRGWS